MRIEKSRSPAAINVLFETFGSVSLILVFAFDGPTIVSDSQRILIPLTSITKTNQKQKQQPDTEVQNVSSQV